MTVDIAFSLEDSGLDCRLSVNSVAVEMGFYDDTLVMRDLLRAAISVALRAPATEFNLEREPGFWVWRLVHSNWPSEPYFEVSIFDVSSGGERKVFTQRCEPLAFAEAVVRSCEDLLARYGETRLEQMLDAYFPWGAFAGLKAILAASETSGRPSHIESAIPRILISD